MKTHPCARRDGDEAAPVFHHWCGFFFAYSLCVYYTKQPSKILKLSVAQQTFPDKIRSSIQELSKCNTKITPK